MHSRIFLINTSKDYIVSMGTWENYLNDAFVGCGAFGMADYVDPLRKDEEDSANWLLDYLKNFGKDFIDIDKENHSFTIKEGFSESYFENRFNSLKKIVEDMTLSEFSDYKFGDFYHIKKLIEDETSFYVSPSEEDFETIDTFVRMNSRKEKTFYIHAIMDYHY